MYGSNLKYRNSSTGNNTNTNKANTNNNNKYINNNPEYLGSGLLQLKKVDSLKYSSSKGASPKKKKK